MNIVPKDRKISNVVLENSEMKTLVEELKYENEKLRDQMEQIVAQAQNLNQQPEELSIFQSKNPNINLPKLEQLVKVPSSGGPAYSSDQREYVQKLEKSVQYLNEKCQKIRIDYKNLKKEN
jgi:predicted transcriptional regulator